MFPGFSSRLETEIRSLYKERILKDANKEVKIKIEIIDNSRRNFSVFIGACFIANIYENKPEIKEMRKLWRDNNYDKCIEYYKNYRKRQIEDNYEE